MRLFRGIKNCTSRSLGQRRTTAKRTRLELETLEERIVRSANPAILQATPDIAGITAAAQQNASTPYTPKDLGIGYGFSTLHAEGLTGAGQTIAIVEAYNVAGSPSANGHTLQDDLNIFCNLYSEPYLQLQVQYQNPKTPPAAPPSGELTWYTEAALDVEWAHVVAPAANIIVFEANSVSFSDLMATVNAARNYPGVSVVSMSWGDSEFTNEYQSDSTFTTPAGHVPITFVASSGDNGYNKDHLEYPAASPNVLAVGGTSLTVASNGAYVSETAWSGSTGGLSISEIEPAYQMPFLQESTAIKYRGIPDVAYNAASNTPVSVYDSVNSFAAVYGTSAGAPQWAGLIALANQERHNLGGGPLANAVADIYSLPASDFHDITSGNNGGESAHSGYDLVTGRGSPIANTLVMDLARTEWITPPRLSPIQYFTTSTISFAQATAFVATAGTLQTQTALVKTSVTAAVATNDLASPSSSAWLPGTADKPTEASLTPLLASSPSTQETGKSVDSLFVSTEAAHIEALLSTSLPGYGRTA